MRLRSNRRMRTALPSSTPIDPRPLRRIVFHERLLAFAHIAAFVITGLAWLAMNHPTRLPPSYPSGGVMSGAFTFTFVKVVWASWPFAVSHFASKAHIRGQALATWLFVGVLIATAIGGGFALHAALNSETPRLSVLEVTIVEAVILVIAARVVTGWRE